MIHFFKFRQEMFDLTPALEVYDKPGPGKGWPVECPPVRAANAFGFDVLANFDVTFVQVKGQWKVKGASTVVPSDFDWSADDETDGQPLTQEYAWFWEKGQKIPHVITDNVHDHIKNQVKLSSFLFLRSDPNELLYVTEIPNRTRGYRAATALLDTDWYPASYPWHAVLELDPKAKTVHIPKGEAVARIIPVRRDTYFAKPMSPSDFDEFFERSQTWLTTHGKHVEGEGKGTLDITRTYVKQQIKSRFVTMR